MYYAEKMFSNGTYKPDIQNKWKEREYVVWIVFDRNPSQHHVMIREREWNDALALFDTFTPPF
jgi:hypothetical protein